MFVDDRLKEIGPKIAHMIAVLLAELQINAFVGFNQHGGGAGADQRLVKLPLRLGPKSLIRFKVTFALDPSFDVQQFLVSGG